RHPESVFPHVVLLIRRRQHFALVDEVHLQRLQHLRLGEMPDPHLRHHRDRHRRHDLPYDFRRRHPRHPAFLPDVRRHALQRHHRARSRLLGDPRLLRRRHIHNHSALQHLRQPHLHPPHVVIHQFHFPLPFDDATSIVILSERSESKDLSYPSFSTATPPALTAVIPSGARNPSCHHSSLPRPLVLFSPPSVTLSLRGPPFSFGPRNLLSPLAFNVVIPSERSESRDPSCPPHSPLSTQPPPPAPTLSFQGLASFSPPRGICFCFSSHSPLPSSLPQTFPALAPATPPPRSESPPHASGCGRSSPSPIPRP